MGFNPSRVSKMLINALEQVIEPLKPAKESRSIELLTRKETAELLRISLPTLAKWSEQGIIHAISVWEDGYITLSEIQNILEKEASMYDTVKFRLNCLEEGDKDISSQNSIQRGANDRDNAGSINWIIWELISTIRSLP